MADLFRKEALKKLRSPDQLDTAVKLTTPLGWSSLAVVGFILLSVVVWSFLGRLPDRVNGLGIILDRDSEIYDVTTTTSGRVDAIFIEVGQLVYNGDQIASLALPDSEAKRVGAQQLFDDLRDQHAQRSDMSTRDVTRRQKNTADQIKALRAKIAADRQQLDYQNGQLEIRKGELEKGYITSSQVENTRASIHSLQQAIRSSNNSISAARTDQVEFENQQTNSLVQLEQQIIEARNNLAAIEAALGTDKVIYSPVTGKVREVDIKIGDFVGAAQQIAVVEKTGDDLELTAFFEIGKGKQVESGMPVEISPTSVKRDIYGTIRGKVLSISELPVTKDGIVKLLGDEDLAAQMMGAGPPIEVKVEMEKDSKTFSGLKWSSSRGPPLKITPGTTAMATVTVHESRPIDLVVPIYETWVGGK